MMAKEQVMMLLMLGMVSSLPTLIGFGQEESHPTCKISSVFVVEYVCILSIMEAFYILVESTGG